MASGPITSWPIEGENVKVKPFTSDWDLNQCAGT